MDTEVREEAVNPLAAVPAPLGRSTCLPDSHKHRSYGRRIDYRAGRALELLGHAIEYLTDELVEEGGPLTAGDSRVQAIQLLMALNRQIYLDCPEVPALTERIRRLIRALGSCFLD